jgi:hypothetical protein
MRTLEFLDGGPRGRSVFAIDVELGPVDHIERRLHPFRAIGIEARRKCIADLVLRHLWKELLPQQFLDIGTGCLQ